jgi:hypothetical protein
MIEYLLIGLTWAAFEYWYFPGLKLRTVVAAVILWPIGLIAATLNLLRFVLDLFQSN